jgi:hypothetical protein
MTKLVALFLLATSTAFASPITSLRDLPTQWAGVAGDLLQRQQATLQIGQIRGETRSDGALTTIEYDVDGTLSIGARSLAITRITMMTYGPADSSAEIYVRFNDELVNTLQLLIRKDDATGTFTARDPLSNGVRRVSLTGTRR